MLRLVDARAVDVVLVWKWDRALREPLDLEDLIPRFDRAGVRPAAEAGPQRSCHTIRGRNSWPGTAGNPRGRGAEGA